MAIDEFDIQAFMLGDMKSFKLIYNQYMGKTYNYLYMFTEDEDLAKDLTQNTFLQLWNSRANIKSDLDIGGYIFTIAKNLLRKEMRHIAMEHHYEEIVRATDSEEYEVNIEESLTRQYMESRIKSLLNEIPEARRNIFMMRWGQGMTNREIAEEQDISEKTVSTQIHRAMLFLKSRLGILVMAYFMIS